MFSAWLLRRGATGRAAAAAVSSACSCSCSVVVATSTASTLPLHRNRTIRNYRNGSSCSSSSSNTSTRLPTTIASPLHLHYDWIPAVPAPAPSPDHSPTTTTATTTTTTKNKNKNSDYTLVFFHGLLGQGRNLKTFARQLVRQEQDRGCRGGILMDLRGHGHSYQTQKKRQQQDTTATATNDAAMNTVSTFVECVDDIRFTLQEFHANATQNPSTGITTARSPTSVFVGHSFGGRLALEYAYDLVRRRQQPPPPLPRPKSPAAEALTTVWLLDTVPGEANASVEHVLDILTQVLKEQQQQQHNRAAQTTKKDMVTLLTEPPYQLEIGTAQWLAMSYDGTDFGFDQEFVTRLKPEFATQDFLGMVRYILGQNSTNTDHPPITVHLVRGGKNSGWTPPILADLDSVAHAYPTTFFVHVLPHAGHNVHVDDLPGLLQLFATHTGT